MIQRTLLLPCSPERAFELWTREIATWWPRDRRHTGDPESAMFVEPTGRFFERARDGREVELGRVVVWDPPARLVLDFYPGTDAEHPTQVTVLFTAEGSGTRVSLEHLPTDRSRDLWDTRAPRYVASWDRVFEQLATAL